MITPEKRYSTWSLARMFETDEATIARWARAGKIPAKQDDSRRWWVKKSDLGKVRMVARRSRASNISPFCSGCGGELTDIDRGPACVVCYRAGWR